MTAACMFGKRRFPGSHKAPAAPHTLLDLAKDVHHVITHMTTIKHVSSCTEQTLEDKLIHHRQFVNVNEC